MDEIKKYEERITISTIHQFKGLERIKGKSHTKQLLGRGLLRNL